MKRIVVIAGTVTLAAGVGVGAAAAYADPSPSPSQSPSQGHGAGVPGGPAPALPGGLPAIDQMLHGEAVAKDDQGAIRTHDWQNGQVTAVSGSSMTVRSADGATWTWTLNGDTKVRKAGKDGTASDIATGDKVVVSGQRTGDTRTAAMVADPPPDFAKLRERMRDLHKVMPRLHGDLRRELPSPPG